MNNVSVKNTIGLTELKAQEYISNLIKKTIYIVAMAGSSIWLIYIGFDFLFARGQAIQILPFRIIGFISFVGLAFLLKKNKLSYQFAQNYMFSFVIISLSYMFAIIDGNSISIYFTGYIMVICIMYQVLHLSMKEILIYDLQVVMSFSVMWLFGRYEFMTYLANGGFATLCVVLLISFIAYSNYNIRHKKAKTDVLLELKNEEVLKKNQEIMESLQYAKRIQESILPDIEVLSEKKIDYFVLYKPKDVVSGDFYWYYSKEKIDFLAVADCTGHGVPGAFMSIMNYNLLNQSIQDEHILEPNKILDNVKQKLIFNLNRQGVKNVRDGMDIAMIAIDYEKQKIAFAGAHNPLWLIRNEELTEVKSDKMSVGLDEFHVNESFSVKTIDILQGDVIYLFSDGYADQFGGEKNKKFTYKQLKKVLLNIHTLSMKQQKVVLENTFLNWKKDEEQIDDVCIMGLKFL
jgi:serine phosphatase RsbU (regulator of sigma subunit)